MSKSDSCGSDPIPQRLRRHVVAPIVRAGDVVVSDRDEIQAEIDAFRSFEDRVSELEPNRNTNPAHTARSLYVSDMVDRSQALRTAYRETIMSLEHFEAEYDESLAENVAAELGLDLVPGFDPEGVPFTAIYREALFDAVQDAVRRRERLVSVLDDETRSLESARERLNRILDSEAPSAASHADARERLDDVARERQEELAARPTPNRLGSHEFCEYVYGSERWTYPVLTAVARAHENVIDGTV
jgi:hypothetical protein